ncbi:dihydrodipicolinate synthase family protein [Oerskovia sp. M15]
MRAVVDAVGDRAHIVAGACSNDTQHAVRMAEQAAEAGAHGLLVVSPYYSRPSQEGCTATSWPSLTRRRCPSCSTTSRAARASASPGHDRAPRRPRAHRREQGRVG